MLGKNYDGISKDFGEYNVHHYYMTIYIKVLENEIEVKKSGDCWGLICTSLMVLWWKGLITSTLELFNVHNTPVSQRYTR